jgi:general secretion pathway protein E
MIQFPTPYIDCRDLRFFIEEIEQPIKSIKSITSENEDVHKTELNQQVEKTILICYYTKSTEVKTITNLFAWAKNKTQKVTYQQIDDEALNRKIQQYYGETSTLNDYFSTENHQDLSSQLLALSHFDEGNASEDLLALENQAPLIQLMNQLLLQAHKQKASDIHLEPTTQQTLIRFRVDGLLYEQTKTPKNIHAALISRLKIMAELDIAQKRLPQDGRFTVKLGQYELDIRVSIIPTTHGERAVLRLLQQAQSGSSQTNTQNHLTLENLGATPFVIQELRRLIAQPHGLILITGPTGSGKTTTLYSLLKTLNHEQLNILTVEDPVEYQLEGIGQVAVNAKLGLTFAHTLRSLLRQDPDVMMIGEIRDSETAEIAIQASLTGHLVVATLHTNDAIESITRLIDMGIEPFLLSSSLLAVMGQRLLRMTCHKCLGKGCSACYQTGFSGRSAVYELLSINPEIASLIQQRKSTQDIREYLHVHQEKFHYQTMKQDAQRYLENGKTTSLEVVRVLGD